MRRIRSQLMFFSDTTPCRRTGDWMGYSIGVVGVSSRSSSRDSVRSFARKVAMVVVTEHQRCKQEKQATIS